MAMFTWHNGEVPEGLPVTQVWGIFFSGDGRILLKSEMADGKKVYSMAGGTPEPFDADRVATLRREAIEEINTTIFDPAVIVGYQTYVGKDKNTRNAQLRMAAIIDKIGPLQPDPASGQTYDRILVHPEKAIKLLSWTDTGEAQIKEAVRVAKAKLGIKKFLDKDELV